VSIPPQVPYAYECVRAYARELLHRYRRGRPAYAGGADRYLLAEQRSGVYRELAVLRNFLRAVEQRRYRGAAPRVARQDAVAPDVALSAPYMELKLLFLHKLRPFCFFIILPLRGIKGNISLLLQS
jgi:acyl carrier protein phosphodiesterase